MKALIAHRPQMNTGPVHLNVKSPAIRRSEPCRIMKPSTRGYSTHENASKRTVNFNLDEAAQKRCKSQLVSKWLALKKHTRAARASAVEHTRTATISSNMPAQQDVNGNREYGDKLIGNQTLRTMDVSRLPLDPRTWTPSDVETWVHHMTIVHSLDIDRSFFHMNGRGLCLMTLKGFLFRVPDHGQLLYDDFRARLRRCIFVPGQSYDALKQTGNKTGVRPSSSVKTNRQKTNVSSSPVDLTCKKSLLTYHTL